MLNLSAFNHNHHASRVKMVAKFIRRGIRGKVSSARFIPLWRKRVDKIHATWIFGEKAGFHEIF